MRRKALCVDFLLNCLDLPLIPEKGYHSHVLQHFILCVDWTLRCPTIYSTLGDMQLARLYEVPPNKDMSIFLFNTPLGFLFDTGDILII